MENLAPIILFVYNRPEHTIKTLEALKTNRLAKYSELYIFSDAAKSNNHEMKVEKVREIISQINGFKKVIIFEAEKNKGLAMSVQEGVSKIIKKYGKVIVLEDDIVTSSVFLEYMNNCLNIFDRHLKIWSISGYAPPIVIKKDRYINDIYLAPRGCSWGWATWENRWNSVDWEVSDYNIFKFNVSSRLKFNKGGNDLSFMLGDQMAGRIDSWAIRWVYSQFKHSKYTVYPVKSLVSNNGMDFTGTHSSKSNKYQVALSNSIPFLTVDVDINQYILTKFKSFYDLNIVGFIGVLSRRIGLYKLLNNLRKKSKKIRT